MSPTYSDIDIGRNKDFTIRLVRTSAWAAGATGWTWTLQIDDSRTSGGTPLIAHAADSAALSDDSLTLSLTFNLATTDTDNLTPGVYQADLISNDESKTLPWPQARGNGVHGNLCTSSSRGRRRRRDLRRRRNRVRGDA